MKSNFSAKVISGLIRDFKREQTRIAPALIMGLWGFSVKDREQTRYKNSGTKHEGKRIAEKTKQIEKKFVKKLSNVRLKIVINTACSKSNLKRTVVIQHQLVEVASGRFLADILMDNFLPQPVQSDRVSQRLAATLQGKGDRGVTDAEPLPIDRANGNAPVIRIHPCQLWYIRGDLALRVRLAFPIEVLYVLGETRPIGYDELVPERP